jgi:aspartate kinase
VIDGRLTEQTWSVPMPIVVQKYGGTSVESREQLLAVAESVSSLRKEGYGVVVVVSARGSTTDSLVSEAKLIAAEPAQRELDMLMTAGERVSMSLLAIALNSIGCPAVSFTGSQVGIITDTRHTDARILEVRPFRVVEELEAGNVVVVGGFQGVSTAKDVTTLGRGGSDTTAVALAAALGAERCEILSDVDGVYTADPNRVEDAVRIDEISYVDMASLARYGATVLKEEAVRFAEREGIAVLVGPSSGRSPGTIVLDGPGAEPAPVTGLTLLPGADLLEWTGSIEDVRDQVERLGRSLSFVVSACGRTAAAADRRGRPASQDPAADATVRPVDLIAVVGPDGGTDRVATEVVRIAEGLGTTIAAISSAGRATVAAVDPGESERILRELHAAFFPATTSSPRR